MELEVLLLFVILALAAEVLGTVGGFGSSMLFVPMAGFFLDFYSVLGITAVFHVSSNLSKIAFFRKGFDKRLILRIGVPGVTFVILGAFMSKYFDARILQWVLALFLVIMSLLLLIFQNWSLKPTLWNSLTGGALSGITAGLLGTGGAIRGLTLAAFNLKTEVFIATSAIIDLGIDVSRTVVYASHGYVHRHDLYLVPILLGVSVLGTYLGKKILTRFSQEQFRKIVLGLILITGIVTMFQGTRQ